MTATQSKKKKATYNNLRLTKATKEQKNTLTKIKKKRRYEDGHSNLTRTTSNSQYTPERWNKTQKPQGATSVVADDDEDSVVAGSFILLFIFCVFCTAVFKLFYTLQHHRGRV